MRFGSLSKGTKYQVMDVCEALNDEMLDPES